MAALFGLNARALRSCASASSSCPTCKSASPASQAFCAAAAGGGGACWAHPTPDPTITAAITSQAASLGPVGLGRLGLDNSWGAGRTLGAGVGDCGGVGD